MEDLKPIIAKNIVELRKSMHWTQAELADKLNYSDKAVSKWERAESVPDVTILKQIADMFQVTTDYLLRAEHEDEKAVNQTVSKHKKRNRIVVALLSASFVFLVATVAFVCMGLLSVKCPLPLWMIYIYTLPIALVVLLVFSCIWKKRQLIFALITLILWSVLLAVYLTFLRSNIWLVFIIGIPSQIIIFLWANLKLKIK